MLPSSASNCGVLVLTYCHAMGIDNYFGKDSYESFPYVLVFDFQPPLELLHM